MFFNKILLYYNSFSKLLFYLFGCLSVCFYSFIIFFKEFLVLDRARFFRPVFWYYGEIVFLETILSIVTVAAQWLCDGLEDQMKRVQSRASHI